jgi:hypothetical protein
MILLLNPLPSYKMGHMIACFRFCGCFLLRVVELASTIGRDGSTENPAKTRA